MPKFLPAHDLLIYLSGGAEILLGIGILFPQTRVLALWGLIAILIVFLIFHVNMLFPSNGLGISIPKTFKTSLIQTQGCGF